MPRFANYFIASPENNYRPSLLSYKAFLIYGLVLLILRLLLGTLPAQSAAVESGTLMSLINQERTNRNIAALFTHQSLIVAAAQKSQDMIDRDYFDHIDPDGNYVWGKIVAAGYSPYKMLGENLAVDFATSEGMVKAWIDSPTHRENMFNSEFADQGLAALYGDFKGRYTNLTASLFGTLAVKRAATSYATPPTPYQTPHPSPPSPASAPEQTEEATITPLEPELEPQEKPIARALPRASQPSAFQVSRILFTLFGVALLSILSADSIIIYRHEEKISRSHSSYHFFSFMLIVLISILIWWW